MQNKHFLFNIFMVLTSLSLSNVIRIATNAVYRHIAEDKSVTECNNSLSSFLLVCTSLSFAVTMCCRLVGNRTPPLPFTRIEDFLIVWKTAQSLLPFFVFFFLPHNCFIETEACMLVFKFCLSAQRTHNIDHSVALLSTPSLPCA